MRSDRCREHRNALRIREGAMIKLNYRPKRRSRLADGIWVALWTGMSVIFGVMGVESMQHHGWPRWYWGAMMAGSALGVWAHGSALMEDNGEPRGDGHRRT